MKRKDNPLQDASGDATSNTNTAPAPTTSSSIDEQIARRAYAIWQERGSVPGAELDDWLQAERELIGNRGEEDRVA